MISGEYLIIWLCIILSFNEIGAVDPDCKEVGPCKCFNKGGVGGDPSQARCDDAQKLDDKMLADFAKNLKGAWDILYIHDSGVKNIVANTFNAEFGKIYINNNKELLSIDKEAFSSSSKTEVLEITGNIKLKESGIFDIAKKLGKGLKKIWLDNNRIEKIPDSAFVGTNDIFKNLEVINIDSQQKDGENGLKAIPKLFISNLPNLTQVSLGSNKIETIGESAFDLTGSHPGNKHVSVFLDSNNIDHNQIIAKNIKTPNDNSVSVGLDLENNPITELTQDTVALIVSIAKNKDGKVYLKDAKIKTCDCNAVKNLSEAMKNNIFGIKSDLMCTTNTKFENCKGTL